MLKWEEFMHTGQKLAMPILAFSRRQWIMRAAVASGGLVINLKEAQPVTQDGLSHTAEAIHQEAFFKASAKRVYEALTDAQQFQKLELLSGVMSSLDLTAKPAVISREPGGSFSIFGAYIVGRQIELVPNQRIVQAWRVMSWDPGVYSIARFELTEQGSGTKLVFDHAGFPVGAGEHLAAGWKAHYWEPLEKYLV
jgi:activator of HSP90 ATPase